MCLTVLLGDLGPAQAGLDLRRMVMAFNPSLRISERTQAARWMLINAGYHQPEHAGDIALCICGRQLDLNVSRRARVAPRLLYGLAAALAFVKIAALRRAVTLTAATAISAAAAYGVITATTQVPFVIAMPPVRHSRVDGSPAANLMPTWTGAARHPGHARRKHRTVQPTAIPPSTAPPPAPTKSPGPTAAAPQGVLDVQNVDLPLQPDPAEPGKLSGQIVCYAVYGPVQWTAVTAGDLSPGSLSNSTGAIADGQSASITVTVPESAQGGEGTVTIDGQAVQVTWPGQARGPAGLAADGPRSQPQLDVAAAVPALFTDPVPQWSLPCAVQLV